MHPLYSLALGQLPPSGRWHLYIIYMHTLVIHGTPNSTHNKYIVKYMQGIVIIQGTITTTSHVMAEIYIHSICSIHP